MASIQARHAKKCATGKAWTTLDAVVEGVKDKETGELLSRCSCTPSYYVTVREGKKLHRERIGKDRQTAERALRKIGTQVDEGAYEPVKQMKFSAWADQWLKSLKRETSTVRSYGSTIAYAKRAFGERNARNVSIADIQKMVSIMEKEGLGSSTCAKHCRVVAVCLQSAVVAGYAARNPVRLLPEGERPRAHKRESAYFENDELDLLFAKMEHGLYRVLFLVALGTGMRLGELSALTWGDVETLSSTLHIRWSYTDGKVKRPKSHEKRDIRITTDTVDLLGAWFGELGSPADDKLVFPGATKSGYLSPDMPRRTLYTIMEKAGIPRVGPTGELRVFHSFRHSFAKKALEQGNALFLVSRHMGHASTDITDKAYGHFEPAAGKLAIAGLDGAFTFAGLA